MQTTTECQQALCRLREQFGAKEGVNEILGAIEAHLLKIESEKLWIADACVKFGDKKPRESTEYWLGAAECEVARKRRY